MSKGELEISKLNKIKELFEEYLRGKGVRQEEIIQIMKRTFINWTMKGGSEGRKYFWQQVKSKKKNILTEFKEYYNTLDDKSSNMDYDNVTNWLLGKTDEEFEVTFDNFENETLAKITPAYIFERNIESCRELLQRSVINGEYIIKRVKYVEDEDDGAVNPSKSTITFHKLHLNEDEKEIVKELNKTISTEVPVELVEQLEAIKKKH